MNLCTKRKQNHGHREQTGGCQGGGGWGRDGVGVWGKQMQAFIYGMDKQQGPTVEHRALYSIPCDKPSWKRILNIKKNVYIYIF